MSSTQDISMDAGQLALSEAQAAVAANNLDMELEDLSSNSGYNPDSPLVDDNDLDPNGEDPIPALRKSTSGKEAASPDDRENKILALKEKLAENGFAFKRYRLQVYS